MLADQIMGVESGGNPYAKNPRSSATGVGQFLASTWLDMLRKYRPDLSRLPQDQQLALRNDPNLSKEMTGNYANENAAFLRSKGIDPNPGNTYLAHFAGPQGALKVLQADPNASATSILGPDVAKANPFLANMTTGQLRSWADQKMGAPIPPAPIPTQQIPVNAMASTQPQMPLFNPQQTPQPTGQSPQSSIWDMFAPPSGENLTNWWNRQNPLG
jgi:hypothetical protein